MTKLPSQQDAIKACEDMLEELRGGDAVHNIDRNKIQGYISVIIRYAYSRK